MFDEMVAVGVRRAGEFRYEDLTTVAQGQIALEDSLAYNANKVLVCDTDVLTTMTWSDHYFGTHEDWIEEAAYVRQYDLTLVLSPDGTDHVQDGTRVMTKQSTRQTFTTTLERNLQRAGRSYLKLTGTHEERYNKAVIAIESLFE